MTVTTRPDCDNSPFRLYLRLRIAVLCRKKHQNEDRRFDMAQIRESAGWMGRTAYRIAQDALD